MYLQLTTQYVNNIIDIKIINPTIIKSSRIASLMYTIHERHH